MVCLLRKTARDTTVKKTYLLLIILIILTGCSQFGAKGTLPDYSSVYSGTEGLSMKFMENAPPYTVPTQSYVPIGLDLENKGAVDITNGIILIRYPQDLLILENNKISVDIEGKETNIIGGRQITILDGLTKDAKKLGTEKPQARIAATSCYDYATKLSAGICINPDSYGIAKAAGRKPACEQKTSTFSGQGAPVAITKVETVTLSRGEHIDIQIKAYIENKGRGVVYRKGGGFCTSADAKENTLFVRASLLGKDTSCLPNNFVLSDRNDENYVTCIFTDLPAQAAFVTKLSVVAEYGYSETISKDFTVDPIPGTCRACNNIETYSRMTGTPQCQQFADGTKYLTAAHEKCYRGCYVEYPDYTTQPPTPC